MPLTKYVSVTFTGGSNDGSTSNPYTTIEAARSDIQTNASDNGPHYIILSESSAAQTVYSASYGMPAGFEQEFWMGSYDRGVIVSGAHGQDIIIDGEGVINKSAFEFYGSGSGAHNLTIRNIGNNTNPNYGALRFTKRPADVRGVTISGTICGAITQLGDYNHSSPGYYDAWTIIDSCRIHVGSPSAARRGISWGSTARHGLVNNCLIIFAGSATDGTTPSRAIYASAGTTYTTASFCTVVVNVDDALHTDSTIGITAGYVTNCIVSMSLAHDSNDVCSFINADTAINNLYAGYNDGSSAAGVRRVLNGTSASFDATALRYKNAVALSLFNSPDSTFKSLYADWTLASGAPAIDAGATIDYFGLTSADISGTLRASSDAGTGGSTDIGAFEFISLGYGNTVIGVVAGSLGKVLGVTKANTSKVIGVE